MVVSQIVVCCYWRTRSKGQWRARLIGSIAVQVQAIFLCVLVQIEEQQHVGRGFLLIVRRPVNCCFFGQIGSYPLQRYVEATSTSTRGVHLLEQQESRCSTQQHLGIPSIFLFVCVEVKRALQLLATSMFWTSHRPAASQFLSL